MSFNYGWRGPNIVKDSLKLYTDAGSPNSFYNKTGTTWNDISGNGNNGTLTNGPTFDSNNGGSIVFDGVDDIVNFGPFSLLTGSNFSLSFWVKLNVNVITQVPIAKDNQFSIGFFNSQISYADGSNWNYSAFGYYGTFNASTWYNIVAVKNNTNVTLYSNSSVVTSQSFGGSVTGNANNFYLGAYAGNSSYFGGNISSMYIYNKSLTSNEVIQNYNVQKTRFGL
jgi:hypothetical protein